MNNAKSIVAGKSLSILLLGTCLAAPVIAEATPFTVAAASAVAGLPDFSDLVEKAGPAVVNIRTTKMKQIDDSENSDEEEQMHELLRRFFGGSDQDQQPAPTPKGKKAPPPSDSDEEVPSGVGSGFITSQDGYVLTNAHVVEGASEVYVKLTDAREFKAKVIGVDARTDVAVLKIDGDHLPIVTIGNSGKSRVGEWVIAIGSPFDLENTVTAGIISAKGRETGDFLPFIQTDVAVNPGNSGGPLINMRGEVVGINAQIFSKSGGYMGISFAIPIDEAMRAADQLKSTGHVTRGRLGVYLADVSKEIAESLGLPNDHGGLVGRIEKGGPADKAGLLDGDIILKFNGVAIEHSAGLRRLVASTPPGTKVSLTVWRNGVAKELPVTLAELQEEKESKKSDKEEQPDQAAEPENAFGIGVSDLTRTQKKELGIVSGVIIERADGAAAHAGLRSGDIILTINNVDIKDAKQFSALIVKADTKKSLLLLVRREDSAQFFAIRPIPK
jgi:serine protease Do